MYMNTNKAPCIAMTNLLSQYKLNALYLYVFLLLLKEEKVKRSDIKKCDQSIRGYFMFAFIVS